MELTVACRCTGSSDQSRDSGSHLNWVLGFTLCQFPMICCAGAKNLLWRGVYRGFHLGILGPGPGAGRVDPGYQLLAIVGTSPGQLIRVTVGDGSVQ